MIPRDEQPALLRRWAPAGGLVSARDRAAPLRAGGHGAVGGARPSRGLRRSGVGPPSQHDPQAAPPARPRSSGAPVAGAPALRHDRVRLPFPLMGVEPRPGGERLRWSARDARATLRVLLDSRAARGTVRPPPAGLVRERVRVRLPVFRGLFASPGPAHADDANGGGEDRAASPPGVRLSGDRPGVLGGLHVAFHRAPPAPPAEGLRRPPAPAGAAPGAHGSDLPELGVPMPRTPDAADGRREDGERVYRGDRSADPMRLL